jgi:hypothetical protein
MKTTALTLVASLATVAAHGHMTLPKGRGQVALDNGQDWCPWCALQDGVRVDGRNPYYSPGAAIVAGSSSGRQGPCGRGSGNYNSPGGAWGVNIVSTYTAGDVIQVDVCWSADHRGGYSYRMCPDQNLVNKFITPGYRPSETEEQQLEDCFQGNVMPCNFPGQPHPDRCKMSSATNCQPGDPCNQKSDWFHAPTSTGFPLVPGVQCNAGNGQTTDYVQIPANFPASNHTLLGWRWDADQTSQLYLNCADVAIN